MSRADYSHRARGRYVQCPQCEAHLRPMPDGTVPYHFAERMGAWGFREERCPGSGQAPKLPESDKRIVQKPGVCGGDAIIAGTRIPVWGLERARRHGINDSRILEMYPALSQADLDAAWW